MMEYKLNKKYTLEEHLRNISFEDKDYEVLFSIWDLNKKNLAQGLNLVSASFPHYSVHDVNHSMTIIEQIQCFLGEDRIKLLSATDTFLILMAGLTHDVGMILMNRIVEDEWKKEDFKSLLEDFSRSSDSVVSKAANIILNIHNNDAKEELKDFSWSLKVKNAVIILTAEIFRARHAKQSANYLRSNEMFKQLANNFHSELLPCRFMDLLADIAFLHGEEFGTVMSKLYYEANGYKGDYIHPRFIACMIRLGDLLDCDNGRFNLYSSLMLDEIPDTSKLHEKKHASVKHMLVSPNSIEIELDCPDEDVYRVSRSWFDWLEKEVNNQSREWSNIAPNDLGGLPPVISKDSIRILYNGIQCNPELLNLRFTMSQEKMFSILQGGGIYKEPGFAFIREIVQNAFDASKIQMWIDIKAGLYESYFNDLGINNINEIKFPDQIPSSVYKQYPVVFQIKWKDEKKEILQFECIDSGTGISEQTLLRMTNHVGESRKNDSGYIEIYKDMPYFLKPTAAFGIGLQSIFFVAPIFEVETLFIGENSKRIIFRSASDGQYCSIKGENIKRKRGTSVKVEIPEKKFKELFGTSFSWSILDGIDIFDGEGDDIYLAKIDNFVRKTFNEVENTHFLYKTVNEDRSLEYFNYKKIDGTLLENYKYAVTKDGNCLFFCIYEKIIGSTIQIWFNYDYSENHRLSKWLFLRDVLVSNASFNYRRLRYIGFKWNLCNQSTDKVVDLSRDNLTYEGKVWIEKVFLGELLPQILQFQNEIFEKYLKEDDKDIFLLSQYFSYSLTSFAFNKSYYNVDYLEKYTLPSYLASLGDLEINGKNLFTADYLYFVTGFKTDGRNMVLEKEKERILEKYGAELNDYIIIWGYNYLYDALIFNYICTEVVKYENDCKVLKLKKRNFDGIVKIKSPEEYLLSLEVIGLHKCTRKTIYGLPKYSDIIVKLNYISGFEDFPVYSTCCIYSPFSEKKQIEELLININDKSDNEIREYIRKNITEYISPYLLEIVKKYNINNNVTNDKIIDGYIDLICDFIEIKKSKDGI